jgi:hypothetical protein
MKRPASLGLGASDPRSPDYGVPRSAEQPCAPAPSWVNSSSTVGARGRGRTQRVGAGVHGEWQDAHGSRIAARVAVCSQPTANGAPLPFSDDARILNESRCSWLRLAGRSSPADPCSSSVSVAASGCGGQHCPRTAGGGFWALSEGECRPGADAAPRRGRSDVVLCASWSAAAHTVSLTVGLASTGLWPATASPTFFPRGCAAFLAPQEARLPPPYALLQPCGCKPAGPAPL